MVRVLEQDAGRLRYDKVSGQGPQAGWVSMAFRGKDLLVKATTVAAEEPGREEKAPSECPSTAEPAGSSAAEDAAGVEEDEDDTSSSSSSSANPEPLLNTAPETCAEATCTPSDNSAATAPEICKTTEEPHVSTSPRYFIVGTWDNWASKHEMRWDGQFHWFDVPVGYKGEESFQILEDGSWDRKLHPNTEDANPHERHSVRGPTKGGHGVNWTVGRHVNDEAKPYTSFKVKLQIVGNRKIVDWARGIQPEKAEREKIAKDLAATGRAQWEAREKSQRSEQDQFEREHAGKIAKLRRETLELYSRRFAAPADGKEALGGNKKSFSWRLEIPAKAPAPGVRSELEWDLGTSPGMGLEQNARKQKTHVCTHCGLPVVGDHAYSSKKDELLHGECVARIMAKDFEEEAAKRNCKAAKIKEKHRSDYDIGWRAERVPRNMELAKKLTGHLMGDGMCCVKLSSDGSHSLQVAPTGEPASSVNLEYLSLALQVRLKEGKEPYFSLDPVADPKSTATQAKRFEPSWLAGTSLGEVMFQADYHLKELSMGEYEQPVTGMKSCFDFCEQDVSGKEWSAREWFVVRKAEVRQTEHNVLVPYVRLAVEAREQVVGADGGLEDVKHTSPNHPLVKYAEAFTHNFDLIAERKSVVFHLREVARAAVLAKFLLESRLDVGKAWLGPADRAAPACCMEVPQLWSERFRSQIHMEDDRIVEDGKAAARAGGSIGVYGGVQFGLDRFSLAQTRAGAPMARAASLSATMMPTRAGAGISATLGARAGISAMSIATSAYPQAFRAAPGALRTARGVDLNLDSFNLSRPAKASPQDAGDGIHMQCGVNVGNEFWSLLDTAESSSLKDEDRGLLRDIFNPHLSDRRDEGDRFIPPDASLLSVGKLRQLLLEEKAVRQSRKHHFFSDRFESDDAGPCFPSSWASAVKIARTHTPGEARMWRPRPEYKAEAAVLKRVLKSAAPTFDRTAEDGTRFRMYRVGVVEVRTTQEDGAEEEVGAVFSLVH